jgi:hypothetical protein
MNTPSLAQYQQQFTENLLSEQLIYEKSHGFLSHITPLFTNSDQKSERSDRFSIYRNNVILSLSTAIADSFPVVQRLIGKTCFNGAAIAFVRNHPPAQAS